jgi:catechol 2,3-dioxygenase-like lactoylglutathione lyase family enzyme
LIRLAVDPLSGIAYRSCIDGTPHFGKRVEAFMAAVINKNMIEIGIVVRNAEKSLEFYRDVLGLPYLGDLEFPGAHMWRFDAGGSVVKLLEMDPEPVGANPPGDVVSTGFRYLSLYVSNIAELVAECAAYGCTIAIDVMEFQPGAKFAFVEDPEGNRIELLDIASPAGAGSGNHDA